MQSRYYNPKTGRFLNADGLIATGQGLVGNNIFAYCGNNPVMFGDSTGYAKKACNLTLGAGCPAPEPEPQPEPQPEPPYINNQKAAGVSDVTLGLSNVGHGGCGAVAVYNALISMGVDCTFADVVGYYNSNLSLLNAGGYLGMMPHSAIAYFVDHGYSVKATPDLNAMDILSKEADAAIMWYVFPRSDTGIGAHFVAYTPSNSGYTAYNTGSKGTFDFSSPSQFLSNGDNWYAWGIYIYE